MNQIYHGDEAYYLTLLFKSNAELKEETYNCGLYEESSSSEDSSQNSYEKLSYGLGDYFADNMPEEVSSGLSATEIYDTELEAFNTSTSDYSFLDDIQAIILTSYNGTAVPWHLNCNKQLYIAILKVVLYGSMTNLFYENRYRFLPNYEWYLIDKNERRKAYVNALFKQYDRWVDVVNGIKNCVDIDAVPDRYLNYLMELTGITLHNYNQTLSEKQIRSLVSNIIEVWRTKGSLDSIKLFFQCMGITASVDELYFDRRLYYTPYSPWKDIATNGNDISEYITTSVDGYSACYSDGSWSDISKNNELSAHTWMDSVSMAFDTDYIYYMVSEDGYVVNSEDGLEWNWWYSDGNALLDSTISYTQEEAEIDSANVLWKKCYASVIDNKNVLCFLGHITSFKNDDEAMQGISNVLAYTDGSIDSDKPVITYKFIKLVNGAETLDINKVAVGIYSFELSNTTKTKLLLTEDGCVLILCEDEENTDCYTFEQFGSLDVDETSDINTWLALKVLSDEQFIALGDHGLSIFNISYENDEISGIEHVKTYYITDKDIAGIVTSGYNSTSDEYSFVILTSDGYTIGAYYNANTSVLEIDSIPTSSTITNRVNTSTDIQGRENYAFYLTPNVPHNSVYEFSADAVDFNETSYPITESVWVSEFNDQLEKIIIEDEGSTLPEFALQRSLDCDGHTFTVRHKAGKINWLSSFNENDEINDDMYISVTDADQESEFTLSGLINSDALYETSKLYTFTIPQTVNFRKQIKIDGNFKATEAIPSYTITSSDDKKLKAICRLLGYEESDVQEKFTFFKTNWLLVQFTKLIGLNEYKAVSDEEEAVFEELMIKLLPSFVKVIYKRSADAKDETLNFNTVVYETDEGFVLRIEDNYYKYINYTGSFKQTLDASSVSLTKTTDTTFVYTISEPEGVVDIDNVINVDGVFDWQGFSYGIPEEIDDNRMTEEIRYSSENEPGISK